MKPFHLSWPGAVVAATALVVVLFTATGTASASSSTAPTTFRTTIGSGCVAGTGTKSSAIRLTWRAASGALKATTIVHTSSVDGTWRYCATAGQLVRIGDLLKASDGNTTRKFVVPELSVVQNRVAASYHGRGPVGEYIRVFCRGPMAGEFEPCLTSWKVKVASSGKWSLAMTYRSVTGGDRVRVRWTSARGDKIDAISTAPYIAVTVNRAGFTGFTNASTVHVQLRDQATNALRATGTAMRKADGSFAGKFKDSDGRSVPVSTSDRVVADLATNADFVVVDVNAVALTPDDVTGRCGDGNAYGPDSMLSGAVVVYQYRNGQLIDHTDGILADDGSFDLYGLSMKPTDKILVGCQLLTGDLIEVWADINPIV